MAFQSDHVAESTATRDFFLAGLRDAHAMEQEALTLMNRQIERCKSYPDLLRRLEAHKTETEGQVRRLQSILDELGDSNSTLKDVAMTVMGNLAALGHTLSDDEVVKNNLANFAFENFEIASYRSLITTAEIGGYRSAITALEANLREEEAMAAWVGDNIPVITKAYLERYATGRPASR